jgi:signal transduction histidine kinase
MTHATPHSHSPDLLSADSDDNIELEQLRNEAQQLRQQVAQYQAMVDMVAHDLNTPLTTLQGYLELTAIDLQDTSAAPVIEYLRIMQGCVERIMVTVGDMYDVVTMEAGHLRLHPRAVMPGALLRRAVQETRVLAERQQQTLHVEASSDLPAVTCDDLRVLQVLQNLISNASKYSPPHTLITLHAALKPDRSVVQFTVTDQGRGIEAAQLPFVFERAYRAHTTAHQVKGAGLGLYLARLLVELHGGRIWCESVVGQGSRFHFTLPVADPLLDY